MKKRLTALLLALMMVLGMLPSMASAASSEEAALGEVNIYNGGDELSYLSINGAVQKFLYTYYPRVSPNGQVKEIPAYCVNPNLYGVPQTVPKGESIRYNAAEKATDPKVMGIVANGYPTRDLPELGLENKEQAYYATKAALWCYIIPGWNINNLKVNPSLSGAEKKRAEKILAAAKDIYQRGTMWDQIYEPNLTVTPDRATAYPVTADGKQYKQQVFTVQSETWICNYTVNVSFADPSGVPAGTRIVDMNNRDITAITTSDLGNGYGGQFKVLYPVDSVAGKSGSVQFALRTNVYRYGIYYAVCAEKDKYGNLQNYMCDTDPTTPMALSGLSSYSDSSTTVKIETGMKIIKRETGSDRLLAGALFEIIDPNGATVGTFATNEDGEINVPLALAGNYTVIERQPALDHKLGENTTQNVTVRYGEVATLTFYNDPYGTLRVQKMSDTGVYLSGVTIQIKNINTGAVYTKKTGTAGVATFDVEPGAYEVREIAGIPGWQADTETIKTVTVLTGDTSTLTFTNKELPGLRIIKYDRKTYQRMAGVTFEIWRDGESLGKFQTDAMGEILLTDCKPGTYRAQEADTGDDGHILDTTPQEVELKAGDGIRELVYINDRLPGIHLIKVDSSDLSKVIPNVRFRFEQVEGNYGPVELTTGRDGTIDLSKLPVGSYVVTELECPGYVSDKAQRIIHLEGNETAQFIFTNSRLPSLHLTKLSGGDTPLAGVSYRLAKIEDGSRYLDRTTSATGEITWEGLEPGVYSLKELSTVETHILDPKEYHVELFAGKDSTIVLNNDRRPNLTLHKNDADTGTPIPGTVFLVKAADGSTVTEVKTGTNGTATIKNLLPMVYEVIEKSVPSPYLLDSEKQLVTLYPNRDTNLYFKNHKAPTIEILKTDKATGKPISGVKFRVWYASNNTSTGELNDLGIFTTNRNGRIQLSGPANGLRDGWFRVQEVEPAPGYALAEPDTQDAFVQAGKSHTFRFENIPLGGLELIKVNASDRSERIPNVTFEVRRASDGGLVETVTTGKNGRVHTALDSGTYYVVEVDCPKAFHLDPTPHYFEVKDGKTTTLTLTNKPFSGILIHKTDSVTGKGIVGVTFLLYNNRHEPLGEYTSDQRGYVYIDDLTRSGRYYLRELTHPDYLPDDELKTVSVKAGETTEVEWKNTPVTGQIQVTKTSADYNPTNGWPAGALISGCEFEIYNKAGNLVDTIRTDKNGIAATRALPLGQYKVVESKAADFYTLDSTPFYVELQYAGQIVRLAATNKSVSTGVSITKTGYKEVMPGQVERFTFTGIGNTSTVALQNFYWRDTIPTDVLRLSKVVTGTWNVPSSYKLVYLTNKSGGQYRTLADNLSTSKNYTIDASPVALGLASDEYVTEVMAVFGVVPAGFHQVETPTLDFTVVSWLQNGYQFTNQADVGGSYNGAWVQANTRWVTLVYAPTKLLPRTGY